MLRVLLDQDFDHNILRGIIQRLRGIDYLSADEAGVGTLSDEELLRWTAENGRVLLTHDLKTMPNHFASLYAQGIKLAGVIVVPRSMSMSRSIEEPAITIACTENNEWLSLLKILPL